MNNSNKGNLDITNKSNFHTSNHMENNTYNSKQEFQEGMSKVSGRILEKIDSNENITYEEATHLNNGYSYLVNCKDIRDTPLSTYVAITKGKSNEEAITLGSSFTNDEGKEIFIVAINVNGVIAVDGKQDYYIGFEEAITNYSKDKESSSENTNNHITSNISKIIEGKNIK